MSSRDPALSYEERDIPNCELSDRDSRELDIHNPTVFDTGSSDFYERSFGRNGDSECLDGNLIRNIEPQLKTNYNFSLTNL